MLTAVVGINWGDEGKAEWLTFSPLIMISSSAIRAETTRVTPLLTKKASSFLTFFRRASFRNNRQCNGNGMVIDLEHLVKEIASLTEKGIKITPKILKSATRQ